LWGKLILMRKTALYVKATIKRMYLWEGLLEKKTLGKIGLLRIRGRLLKLTINIVIQH